MILGIPPAEQPPLAGRKPWLRMTSPKVSVREGNHQKIARCAGRHPINTIVLCLAHPNGAGFLFLGGKGEPVRQFRASSCLLFSLWPSEPSPHQRFSFWRRRTWYEFLPVLVACPFWPCHWKEPGLLPPAGHAGSSVHSKLRQYLSWGKLYREMKCFDLSRHY